MKTFICDYFYKGERWAIHIPADSWEEAESKMRQIGHGQIIGELKAEIPVSPLLLFRRIARWF